MTYPNAPQLLPTHDPEMDRFIQQTESLDEAVAKLADQYGTLWMVAAMTRYFNATVPGSKLECKIVSDKTARPDPGMAYGCSDCFTDVADYNQIPDPDDAF